MKIPKGILNGIFNLLLYYVINMRNIFEWDFTLDRLVANYLLLHSLHKLAMWYLTVVVLFAKREQHTRACIPNGGQWGNGNPLPQPGQGIKIRSLVYQQGRVANTFAEANQKTVLTWINRLKSSINWYVVTGKWNSTFKTVSAQKEYNHDDTCALLHRVGTPPIIKLLSNSVCTLWNQQHGNFLQ